MRAVIRVFGEALPCNPRAARRQLSTPRTTPVERPDMLPEAAQGQGATLATATFTVFAGSCIWHFMGIDERRVNNHLCKIDEFRMFVTPASRVYGVQTFQSHDSRPWGHETNIATVKGGRNYITSICYRKASKSGEPVPNVGDYKLHLIPRSDKTLTASHAAYVVRVLLAVSLIVLQGRGEHGHLL
jgi:hypothetical protein